MIVEEDEELLDNIDQFIKVTVLCLWSHLFSPTKCFDRLKIVRAFFSIFFPFKRALPAKFLEVFQNLSAWKPARRFRL